MGNLCGEGGGESTNVSFKESNEIYKKTYMCWFQRTPQPLLITTITFRNQTGINENVRCADLWTIITPLKVTNYAWNPKQKQILAYAPSSTTDSQLPLRSNTFCAWNHINYWRPKRPVLKKAYAPQTNCVHVCSFI